MSQYWGRKDIVSIKKVLGLDITIGFIASLIFGGAAFIIAEPIMKILSRDIQVIELGVQYLRIIAIALYLLILRKVFLQLLEVLSNPKHRCMQV